MNTATFGSTAMSKIDRIYQQFADYRNFRAGAISKEIYVQQYHLFSNRAIEMGLTEDDCYLTTRFCFNEEQWVNQNLKKLKLTPIIYSEFLRVRQLVWQRFYHAGKTTYIFQKKKP